MIKWGIIGLGNMGQKFASAMKETSNAKIISVASQDKNKIKNFKDNYNLNKVTVYNNYDASERLLPFDLFPRVITNKEWGKISKGVIQRALAINAFLHDIYHSGEIMKTNIIPRHLVYGNPAYEIKMVGFKVVFTEQGMQEDGMASMEGGSEGFDEAKNTPVSDDINRLRKLAGV